MDKHRIVVDHEAQTVSVDGRPYPYSGIPIIDVSFDLTDSWIGDSDRVRRVLSKFGQLFGSGAGFGARDIQFELKEQISQETVQEALNTIQTALEGRLQHFNYYLERDVSGLPDEDFEVLSDTDFNWQQESLLRYHRPEPDVLLQQA